MALWIYFYIFIDRAFEEKSKITDPHNPFPWTTFPSLIEPLKKERREQEKNGKVGTDNKYFIFYKFISLGIDTRL